MPERFKTGVQQIDEQHAFLLEAITGLMEEHRDCPAAFLSVRIGELASLLRDHFSSEEALLSEIGYPQLDQHAEHHQRLLNGLRKHCSREERDSLADLHDLLDILIRDMGGADLGLQEFIEAQRVTGA